MNYILGVITYIVKGFQSKMELRHMETLTPVPSEEQNWRTESVISIKCLIYRRPRLISWPMNIHQEFLPILMPVNLVFGLESPLFGTPCP